MKILSVIVNETTKDGNPLIDKFTGKPQCMVFATFEGDNKQRCGFIKDIAQAKSWKIGDDIDVVLSEKESNGKTFYNFKLATKNDKALAEVNLLKAELKKTQDFIKKLVALNKLKVKSDDFISPLANLPM